MDAAWPRGEMGATTMHLIADDNSVFRSTLKRILGRATTRTAATPDEAIDLVAERPPSVVVMDVWFNNQLEDGIEAIPRIRLLSPATQIVVCSGYYSEADAARAKRYGAYAYMEKMHCSELLAVIAAAAVYSASFLSQFAA